MTSPYHFVFDLGGVLVDWDPRYLYSQYFDDKQEMEYFLNEVCTQDWNEEQDAGRTFADGVALLSEKFPQYARLIALYDSNWETMLKGEISENVNLLKDLHQKNYSLYALTNWSHEKFPIAQKRFSFFKLFQAIVVSGELKIRKPNPKIFQYFLDTYNKKAEDCVFIDDKLNNVSSAMELGMKGVHYTPGKAHLHDLLAPFLSE